METENAKNDDNMLRNNYRNIQHEEIIAQDHNLDNKDEVQQADQQTGDQNQNVGTTGTYSSIEFDKHQLFFHSQPNVIAFDTVTTKNTGKTCIYYEWQKKPTTYELEDKRSDGMNRFFCYYSNGEIFPDEEKEFTFSFFSEKNGVFSEEWELFTTPPLKNCNLVIHLNGLVHKYEDLYSQKIDDLECKIKETANNTSINEFILDLVDSIKEQEPPKPNMMNEKIFSYYFNYYNKEYNVEFSKRVMDNLNKLNNSIMNDVLGIKEEEKPKEPEPEPVKEEPKVEEPPKEEKTPSKKVTKAAASTKKKEEPKVEEPPKEEEKQPSEEELKKEKARLEREQEYFYPKDEIEEKKFWNGSIDVLKERIKLVTDEEKKFDYTNKLNCILHIAHKKGPEDSTVYDFVKKIFLEELENFNDTSNKIREEMNLPPYIFDVLTRQSLNEADLARYDAEIKKKKEDFAKKNKKKPPAKGEEDKDENEVYRNRLSAAVSANILEKINDIGKEKGVNSIKDTLLKSNILNENYLDRLSRIKTFNHVKAEGGYDNRCAVLRVDIEQCKRNYEDQEDEEGNVIGTQLKSIDFLDTKDKILKSLNHLLRNGTKAVFLLVDFGPKFGSVNNEYSTKDLAAYIETNLESPGFFCKDLNELQEYNKKIDEEDIKDNCCIVMENINFFPEECGAENFQDDLLNPEGKEKALSLYQKRRFLDALTEKSQIYVNDSIFSLDKYTPTVIDMKTQIRVLGNKVHEPLRKILDFFSIDNKEYILIMGDNDIFRVRERNQATSNENNGNKNKTEDDNNNNENNNNNNKNQDNILDDGTIGGSEILDYNDEETLITNLLIINAIMNRFKKIFIYGKLSLHFIQFLRQDYDLFDNSLYPKNENIYKLIKYILVKAYLMKIEIILPEDFKILDKEEFKKHSEPYVDSNGVSKDYTKEIKFLLKRERIQRRLEKTYTDPEELAENADYQRVKLEPEQIEHLKLYKEETVFIDRMPYCYDFIREFQIAQGIEKPKKIFKTPLEEYKFNSSIYDKEIVFPEEVIQSIEYNKEKLKKFREKLAQQEEEEKKKLAEGGEAQQPEEKKPEEKKPEENPAEPNKENAAPEGGEGEAKEEKKEEEPEKKKKKYDPRLYDYEKMELVDFGEKTYQRLCDTINQMHGVMWLGRLSPSKCENVFDNYLKIINTINARKKQLKEKFEEDQATETKKLHETHIKARKQLLNIFLKSQHAYEVIKDTYKMIMSGQANPDELGEEEEGGQDEEQFSHDMHSLIDYFIYDDFELINSILKGQHISGFYGLDKDELIQKEEEFDPKSIEEITN